MVKLVAWTVLTVEAIARGMGAVLVTLLVLSFVTDESYLVAAVPETLLGRVAVVLGAVCLILMGGRPEKGRKK